MEESEHKSLIRQYVEGFNRGDFEALRALFTNDALVYGVLGFGAMDQVIPIWRELHTSFAITLQIEDIAEEGDTVAVRYTERGKSVGQFRGHESTGRSYEVVAMEWFEIRDGKIHRRWGARDSAAQFRQMGLPLG